MNASDQEEVTETPEPGPESGAKGEPAADTVVDADAPDEHHDRDEHDDRDEHGDVALTPRQARRIRVVVASVLLVAMAALLAVRLANRSSVLVVGLYGFAMILCGVVIELSRHGRTRLATWVLGAGLAGTLATDWLLLP